MSADLVTVRVTVNPQVRSGQPIICGTRITVSDILRWLGGGMTESEVLSDFPELTTEDIRAARQATAVPQGRPERITAIWAQFRHQGLGNLPN